MPRSLYIFVLLLAPALLLSSGVLNAQTDPALLRFIPANPKAVLSVDWKTLRATHIGALLREKYVDVDPASAIPGVEFLDDVERFIIASPTRAHADETSEPPMLVVARGHFDLAKVRQVLADHGAKPQLFNSIQVYRPQGKNGRDMAFVLMDAQTILIGDAGSIFASLERNANPTPSADAGPLLARAVEMDSHYDLWALMSGMQAMASDRLMGWLGGGGFQSESRNFEAGVSLRNGLAVDISLIFPSEPEARSMASEFSKLMKAAIKDKIGGPAMLDLEKRLKVAAEGATTKISLRMTPQEFERNAQIFAAARQQQVVAAAEIKPVGEAIPAPGKPAPQVIRIEGLDDGPREIRLKPEQQPEQP
jgi:hypothetical protein